MPETDQTEDADAKLNRELKEVSCPYDCNDHRARIWLDGYQACLAQQMKEFAA